MTESYTVTVEPLGSEISCRADQTILDACLREGIWLPHACTHGTCGTCKAEILDGEADLGDASPYALLESERDEGAALICVATPRSDLVIEGEVDVEDGIEIHPVRDYAGTLEVLEDVAPGVRRLVIALDTPMAFNAGQYVQLTLPGGGTRPYSIASPPSQADRIELQVKRTDGGAATAGWIFAGLAVGDRIAVAGPYGRFCFNPAREEPVLLLGTGTGLAPLAAIVRTILDLEEQQGWERPVVLYHGTSTVEGLYDRAWYEELAETRDWFDYRPAVSQEDCGGRRGRVPALMAADFPRASGHVAYVCGSPAMVEDTMKALMKARLFPRYIYREDFFDAADRASGANVVRSPLIRR
ncbi:2Fe-2S iron-sulfur cluster-binding protein [Amycolatopsis orientalis]|uniref:2Fe-2S iron-sulfur cluster-binding protein n=1 Tax=Amycolatopsis orientalis TaxID=31958 RepID=UPI00039BB568|nr:2Fe-2S iron-sulfur cluster-binding protein [Amycolatopsis orientalis]